ncbi:sugar transferase [Endothiovibrio diazotrophicus]
MKRLFDLVSAVTGLVMLFPVLLLVALWIKLDSPGPVFFRQWRVGRRGHPFRIWKFRTMVRDGERQGLRITVGGDARITRSGRLLRKFKFDELPQLLNVVSGDMSLVGPRPEVAEYVAHYPDDLRELVLSVRPGITDLASVEYRDENERLARAADPHKEYIEQILPIKLEYYRRYVEERSFWRDLWIIALTVGAIFTERSGAGDGGE